jgi:hypothetical protein
MVVRYKNRKGRSRKSTIAASVSEGSTWFALPDVTGFWAVAFASPKAGWLWAWEAPF